MRKYRKHNAKGRTVGAGADRFVQIPYWVLESDAFLAVSSSAIKLLLFIMKRHNGVNNGKIAFGARSGCLRKRNGTREYENVSIGIGRSATADALAELEAAGFIRCTKESTFRRNTSYAEGQRSVREWRITWLADDDGAATKDFVYATGQFRKSKIRSSVRPAGQPTPNPSTKSDGPTVKEGKETPAVRRAGQLTRIIVRPTGHI
jgi:hypothetical protein